MKLLWLVLLSVVSYYCCTGYPVVESEISYDILNENETSIDYWIDTTNETSSNDSSPLDIDGFLKKVVDKVKEVIKTVQERIIDGYNKIKINIVTFSFASEISYNLAANETSIDSWIENFNETISNGSSSVDMDGFVKKVVNKVTEVVEMVKDRMMDGYNKVKDHIKGFKDNIITISFTGEMAYDILDENGTSIDYWIETFNETYSNDSSSLEMHGFGKKVVNKVKEGIKTVKDKMKDGYNKIKDKIKEFKDKIGSKGGTGGGYYRDKYDRDYDRDYNRDRYNRDYNRDIYDRDYRRNTNYGGGGSISESTITWLGVGFGIFIFLAFVVVIYFKVKHGI